jgi:predicted nucleic acid-binding protein
VSTDPVFVDTWGWCALGYRADHQADRFTRAWALRKQLDDKPNISFTDLTSMVIMQERHIVQVLTEDAHFAQVGLGFSLVP